MILTSWDNQAWLGVAIDLTIFGGRISPSDPSKTSRMGKNHEKSESMRCTTLKIHTKLSGVSSNTLGSLLSSSKILSFPAVSHSIQRIVTLRSKLDSIQKNVISSTKRTWLTGQNKNPHRHCRHISHIRNQKATRFLSWVSVSAIHCEVGVKALPSWSFRLRLHW